MTPFETLVKYRKDYPVKLSPQQIGELLNRVAWDYRIDGMALLGKPDGNNVPTPSGELVSSDYLIHWPTKTGYDVLTDNVNTNAIPVPFEWNPPGPENLTDKINGGSRYIVMPLPPTKIPVPVKPPVEPEPDSQLNALKKELEDLKKTVGINKQRMEDINLRFEKESEEMNVHKTDKFVGKSRMFGGDVVSTFKPRE